MRVPDKVRDLPGLPRDRQHLLDRLFFGFGTAAAVWLAWVIFRASLTVSWWGLLLLVAFWLTLAYLALPRLNRILASIYVPDYFIGRTRTSDGLLGDPLNLAFRGSADQLATTLRRAGWIRADPVTLASSVRIVTATLSGRSYAEAPVSPLLLFGRPQDAAYQQEVAGNPAQRHHVRLWRTPEGWLLPGGHRVDWLAGGTYDRRVGLSLFTLQITHKIDADIDVERDHIVASLTAAEPAARVVELEDFTTGYHSRNGGGDTVHTDGTLPIVELGDVVPDDVAGTPGGSLEADAAARMPVQVLLPALLALAIGPLAVVGALAAWDGSAGPERAVIATAVALALAATAAGATLLRRSPWARRLLLALASVIVVVRLGEYEVADTRTAVVVAILQAGAAVLLVVALSSPAATAWCRGKG